MNTADYLIGTTGDQRIAIIEDGIQYTYGHLRAASAGIARSLVDAGMQPGDHVGILGSNSLFWAAAYLAILKLGAVAVPLSPAVKPAQLQEMQNLVACRAVCLQAPHHTGAVRAVFSDCVILTDAVLNAEDAAGGYWPATDDFPADQLAALMLTSGTTARPRAVCVTHRNLQANTDSIIAALGIEPDDRMMVVLPFYYCFGTSLLHTHLRVGASLVLSNGYAYPEVVLDQMEATGCTSLAGVPAVYQMLLRRSTFPRRQLPALRKLQQAGGKLPPVLIKELADLRPNSRIFIMYGQTEATARLSCLPPEHLHDKIGSIGRGIPGVELRVLNDTGQHVRPGEVGEIIACGDNITGGYFQDPESTARTFAGGVLHTGDLATVDDDGFIYIVDRKSDFIKSLGHRVSSYEIESCVMSLPDVVLAAAIGVADPVQGEAIRVYVTLRPDAALGMQTIITHCKRFLPHHMVPKEVVIADSLPMNAHGKVLKAALRETEYSCNGATDPL